jgi:hypothetical protein
MVVMAIRHLQAEPPRPPGQISYRHGHEPTPHFGENVPRGVTRTPPSAAVSDWMPSQKATQQWSTVQQLSSQQGSSSPGA